jgi:GH43 family beta-xylosidase
MKNYQTPDKLLVYTRKPKDDYTESLANSVHFAYSNYGEEDLMPLNRNYGILFAEAIVDEQNVIHEMGLKNPYIFQLPSGSFGIIAVRITKEGKEDKESKGQILLWTPKDLIRFQYEGLVKLHEDVYVDNAICSYNQATMQYEIRWQDSDGQYYKNTIKDLYKLSSISRAEHAEKYDYERPKSIIQDIVPGNVITLDPVIGEEVYSHWTPLYHKATKVSKHIKLKSIEELDNLYATALYSDGSTDNKRVVWAYDKAECELPGTYTIKGKVVNPEYKFPLARGYADPVILPWKGKYYYMATNDNKNDIGIYVREADTIRDLFAPGYKETIILDVQEDKNFIQTFWAPEFHIIGDELYILFAVGGRVWGPQCHMMRLKKGGNILEPTDWMEPIRVKKRDGSYLAEDGITLDMTYFKVDGTACLLWSYRKGIGTPLDTGSMIYIATVDEQDPTVLTSEPVLLSRPLYGWENIQGTINNEGPYPLITDDTVYITYSGGAAGGYTYALGLLSIPRGSDFLDPRAWTKSSTPVLSYYMHEGVYGPGHNSFFRDYNGKTMIMYHGEEELVTSGTRCSAMHRVHFNKKGIPVFDVIGKRDINPELTDVEIEVTIS